MSGRFTESVVEQAAHSWLENLGWSVRHGNNIAPGDPGAKRKYSDQVFLGGYQSETLPGAP